MGRLQKVGAFASTARLNRAAPMDGMQQFEWCGRIARWRKWLAMARHFDVVAEGRRPATMAEDEEVAMIMDNCPPLMKDSIGPPLASFPI